MTPQEKEIIEKFLDKANPKIAKDNLRFLAKEKYLCQYDILLGISISEIKESVTTIPPFTLESIHELLQSEYNEARVLGWALLIRDFPDLEILSYSVLKYAQYCGNINVVDFAAHLIAKTILKISQPDEIKRIGYKLLFKEENVLTKRFSLIMSLPLIRKNYLNYPIDIIERCISSKEESIRKICGVTLREIKKINSNLYAEFISINLHQISSTTIIYAEEK